MKIIIEVEDEKALEFVQQIKDKTEIKKIRFKYNKTK